jgi:hypothetical protein
MGHGHNKSDNFFLSTCLHFFKAVMNIVLIVFLWTAKLTGTVLIKVSDYLEKHFLK